MRNPKSTISPLSEEVTSRLSLPIDDAPSPARITVGKRYVTVKIERDDSKNDDDPLCRAWFNQREVDLCCVFLGRNGSWWDCNQKGVPVKNKLTRRAKR